MIIKKRDSKDSGIKERTSLLSLPLTKNKKSRIEEALRILKFGDQGENDAAYFIDFHFASSKNWAVIHDLRLEHKDRVAQIDHLMINRFFDIYILETKSFSSGMKITDTGEFLRRSNNEYVAIESPIEQNERHRIVLEKVIEQYDVMPKRLGLTIVPTYRPYVLISPKSLVIRPSKEKFDTSMVIKADTLRTAIDKENDNMSTLSILSTVSKLSLFESVVEAAKLLAARHKPMKMDYRKRFGIEDTPVPQVEAETSNRYYCSKCKKTITEKAATFCWDKDNKKRFGGKAYCFNCQKDFPK